VPLQAGCASEEFRTAITQRWFPALEAFQPELILISAGFDAHAEDPLASINLVDADFAWITQRLMDIADRHCHGRIVSMLEGGYSLPALGRSAAEHVRELMTA